jgi:hypothetical protein
MRKFKIIGLAVVAVMAICAVSASAASAASYKSNSTSGTTFLQGTAEGNQTFQAGTVPVVCTGGSGQASYAGTSTKEISTSKIEYTGCTVAGQTAEVNFGTCGYTFGEPTGSASPFTVATIKIGPSGCGPIVITAKTSKATIKVGAQTTTGTTKAKNNGGSPETVTLEAAISGIEYTSSGGICGTAGTRTNGTYSGALKVTGFSDSAHTKAVNLFIG